MSANDPRNICPQPPAQRSTDTRPHTKPIHLTSVWECETPEQANALLGGELQGYVYQRDGHPNADEFAEKCAQLHQVERVAVTSSGMAALAAALLSQCKSGDHIVISNQLYGRSLLLFQQEAERLQIECSVVDPCDRNAVNKAIQSNTRMLVVETIANPLLRVPDLKGLSEITRSRDVLLLVDNTFATPILCRPSLLGADLVMESVSKSMNGHSDVMLGMLGGRESLWDRVPLVLGAWGLSSSPLECWLSTRGMATMALRVETSSANAANLAHRLVGHPAVTHVDYPGLERHPDHEVAKRQFQGRYGSMVSFHLQDDADLATRFIQSCQGIPFCPSLGELSTTLSHPQSTSHRSMNDEDRRNLGIHAGTIRLSVGIEDVDFLWSTISQSLDPLIP